MEFYQVIKYENLSQRIRRLADTNNPSNILTLIADRQNIETPHLPLESRLHIKTMNPHKFEQLKSEEDFSKEQETSRCQKMVQKEKKQNEVSLYRVKSNENIHFGEGKIALHPFERKENQDNLSIKTKRMCAHKRYETQSILEGEADHKRHQKKNIRTSFISNIDEIWNQDYLPTHKIGKQSHLIGKQAHLTSQLEKQKIINYTNAVPLLNKKRVPGRICKNQEVKVEK